MFNKAFVLAILIVMFAGSAFAKKQKDPENINFGTYNCKQFVKDVSESDSESAGLILMWLDGYLSGVSGDNVLNWKNMEVFAEKIVVYCANNPGKNLLEASKAVGIARK